MEVTVIDWMFCAVQTWPETSVFVCRFKMSRLCPGWKYLNVSPKHPHFIIYYYSFYVGINRAGKILWHLGKNMVLLPQTQLKVLWHIINEINRWTEIRTFCLLKTNLIIPWHLVISIPVFWGFFATNRAGKCPDILSKIFNGFAL